MNILGIKLPDIKLPEIKLDKNLLSKGVDLLKGVAKDMFTPAKDGKNLFKEKLDINIGGYHLRLKNPVESLSDKLLPKLRSKLQEYGFNMDVLLKELGGKRDVKGVGDAVLPPPASRTTGGKAPVGGGTTTTGTSGTTGASGTKAPSTTAPAATPDKTSPSSGGKLVGADYTEKALNSFGGKLDSLEGQIDALMGKGELSEKDSIQLQRLMQQRSMLFSLLTQIMQMEHDTKKQIINNLRS